MMRYSLNPRKDKSVRVLGRGLKVSRKNSMLVCREISGKSFPKAKAFVERLVNGEQDMDGKYYTNASKEILELLKSAENNAEFKGLDAAKLIVNASAHNTFRFYRPRRFKMKRQLSKGTNIQLVLVEK
jgi:large subunit ribosomal protein L22